LNPAEVMKVVPYALANRDLHVTNEGWACTPLGESFIELPVGKKIGLFDVGVVVRGIWVQSSWGSSLQLRPSWASWRHIQLDGQTHRLVFAVPDDDTLVRKVAYFHYYENILSYDDGAAPLVLYPIHSAPTALISQAYRQSWRQVCRLKELTSGTSLSRVSLIHLHAVRLALKERLQLLKERLDAAA